MNILVQLSHPAHFHLYKNCIRNWQADGHQVFVLIKTKDILEELLQKSGIPYYNILPIAHRKNRLGILMDMFIRDWKILCFCIKHKVDLLTGSTPEVAQVAWVLRKKAVNTGEDDLAVVPAFQKVVRPFMQCFLAPVVCDGGVLEHKTTHYPSYHELAYLHPNHFTPSADVVRKAGIDPERPYFILRFASLGAHHDKGIKGINRDIAARLVGILNPHGQIYITSERPLEPEFEPYRIRINPLDMHHVMAFASLYIGDSQTMAAEAGVLGTPFVRFNDFVGRIGYLDELEEPLTSQNYTKVSDTNLHSTPENYTKVSDTNLHTGTDPLCKNQSESSNLHTGTDPLCKFRAPYLSSITHHYNLGVGIRASEPGSVDCLCQTVKQMVSLSAEDRAHIYGTRRQQMLNDKIDYAKFLTWFIEHYPTSVTQSKQANKAFWERFK